MNIDFTAAAPAEGGTVIFLITDGDDAAPADAYVRQVIAAAAFRGERGRILSLFKPTASAIRPLLLVGLGPAETLDAAAARDIGGKIGKRLREDGVARADLVVDDGVTTALSPSQLAAHLAIGVRRSGYSFDHHKTRPAKEAPLARAINLCVHLRAVEEAKAIYEPMASIERGVTLARDLTNEPGNIIYPASFAARCQALAGSGLVVEALDQAALENLGMGALLGVAQGSAKPPQVVTLRWSGAAEPTAPIAVVGKGVTFDSGGLLPKGPEEMWDMKNDMAGAAAVVGLMQSLAERGVPINVVGVIGLVENMPSGHAQRPGDIVRSLSGQTIEVLHTDAEGRLVLADLLTYSQRRFNPRLIIDIATLTGAMTAVLGQEYAGLFSNDDKLAELFSQAAAVSGEKVWRLPLCDAFDRLIDSTVADMQNITKGRYAGSATAAQFLRRFVNATPWAHLDIAGVAWRKEKDDFGVCGATGYGVRLLGAFIDRLL